MPNKVLEITQAKSEKWREIVADGVLSRDDVFALVNALYLNASWLQPFDAGQTRTQAFTTGDGTKVQIPMARGAIVLAANQGLLYVLSMVVIGGLVGGGALGYDVVAGFRQISLFGKGLAAGLAIVLLGIMLDRVTQAVAHRADVATHGHH